MIVNDFFFYRLFAKYNKHQQHCITIKKKFIKKKIVQQRIIFILKYIMCSDK